jgi:hypothetical protein
MVALIAATPPRPLLGRGHFDRMVCLIRAEFDEMPGMRLTRAQFRRLWQITESECDAVVRHLVDTGFLVETARGVSRPPDY